jgi:hypothetical protein
MVAGPFLLSDMVAGHEPAAFQDADKHGPGSYQSQAIFQGGPVEERQQP